LTLEFAFTFCGGGRASPTCCAPLDAGRGCCVLATGCDGADGAGTLAAGGVARGCVFAAAIAESTFSERGGALGAAGGVDGLPGADEALGGTFSVIRAMGALVPDPLAGAIGGGIAGRVGAGRGGGELDGAGRVGSAACAAGGEAGGEEAGRPCSGSVGWGRGVVGFAGPAAGARDAAGGGAAEAAGGARGTAGAGGAADAAAGHEGAIEAATFVGGASATTGVATPAASFRRPGAPGARRGEGWLFSRAGAMARLI
jgi:hypothetical protein